MGGVGSLCSLPSHFTPSSFYRCNLVLQRLYTHSQTQYHVAYFSNLNRHTMQHILLLVYLPKLTVYRGRHYGIYAHLNKGSQKLAHDGAQKIN